MEEGTGHQGAVQTVAQICRVSAWNSDAQYELKLARNAKSNEKGFFRYAQRTRKRNERAGLLLNKDGQSVSGDREGGAAQFLLCVWMLDPWLMGRKCAELLNYL